MTVIPTLYNLPPLEPIEREDLGKDLSVIPPIDDEEWKLQTDLVNVLEGRIKMNTFPKDYQTKMKNYYRFSATRYCSDTPLVAKRTNTTLDIV